MRIRPKTLKLSGRKSLQVLLLVTFYKMRSEYVPEDVDCTFVIFDGDVDFLKIESVDC